MVSKVAIVEFDDDDVQGAFQRALKSIGGINDLNVAKRTVVIKPGVFHHKKKNHPTPAMLNAIVEAFDKAKQVFIVESDNYKGTGTERLQIWKDVFTKRVMPFNLSEDTDTKKASIAGEQIGLSHLLYKPNVFVSVHVLRKTEMGTILKNLLGLMPEPEKARFHKKLPNVLIDAYEAIDGIDLAVIDGTMAYRTITLDKGVKTNVLIVGRDAVAVEVVGATIMGVKLAKMPILQEAVRRKLGEDNLEKIQILGAPVESIREKIRKGSP